MQLPIDVMALINEMTDIGEAAKTPLSVSVYIDESAPSDLAAHVRNAFASSSPSVRMTVSYLDSTFMPHPTDDLAVIAAGSSSSIGAAAAAIRAVGVPVMIASTAPDEVSATAEAGGHAIPEGDLVTPVIDEGASQPVPLEGEAVSQLEDRMGRWLVAACHDKRLALSLAFPFMRRPLARDAVQTTSLQNVGVGLIPVPGADLPIMTLNQAKMVLQIAAAYGHEMNKDRVKEIGACLGSAFICRTLARELTEFVPFLGWLIKPGIAFGGTAALGYAIIEYFEGGENVTGVANVVEKATAKGAKAFSFVRKKADKYVPIVVDKLEGAGINLGGQASDTAEGAAR